MPSCLPSIAGRWGPVLLLFLGLLPHLAAGQARFQTRTGLLSFFSASPLEDIEARSQQTAAVLDLNTRQVAFSLPVKSFQFRRTLMQEHFNENYLESDRYPRATFAGRLLALDEEALRAGGARPVTAEGDLTIHGVTRHVQVPGTLELQNGRLRVLATFNVAPADYQIDIPALVRDHIAKVVQVRLDLSCEAVAATAGAPAPSARP
ncbi:YceI family protein [Hymenobacter yonginensis]|uniref:YceI family protein n=1 Tax=Hymenobacter yonginensis TaxID=748197 RepID=A0ABY7PM57_9BACT|nr:YceI family protein [Hymenobacter yonginensis]WBO83378.1 YceI family protein [Hymenobacter yonginensis]